MMKKKDTKIIVFNVTSLCNLTCDFCYGPERMSEDYTTEECIGKIKGFKEDGYSMIVFSGGEPLLRGDIVDLIEYAKKLGFFVALHTNGYLYDPVLYEEICRYVDQINFPIDGSNKELNDKVRGMGHFDLCMKSLKFFENKEKTKVVVSTVVTSINLDDVPKIGDVLPNFINKWRVFQYRCEYSVTKKIMPNSLSISISEFEKLKKNIDLKKYSFEIQMVAEDDEEFYGSYDLK